MYGGGGLYLSQRHNPQGYTRSMTFLFENCTFESNISRTKVYKSIYNDILGVLRNGYGEEEEVPIIHHKTIQLM